MLEFEGKNVFIIGALQIATIVAAIVSAIGFIYLQKKFEVTDWRTERLYMVTQAFWLLLVPLGWCTAASWLLTIKSFQTRTQVAIILTGYVIWAFLIVGLLLTCSYGLAPLVNRDTEIGRQ